MTDFDFRQDGALRNTNVVVSLNNYTDSGKYKVFHSISVDIDLPSTSPKFHIHTVLQSHKSKCLILEQIFGSDGVARTFICTMVKWCSKQADRAATCL